MIPEFLEKLFGPNWRTTTWGFLTILAAVVSFQPDAIAFLPDNVEKYVRGICGIVAIITAGKFVANTKDKDVTGGTVPATKEAKKRVDD